MLLALLNTRGWSEGKWRTLIEEGKEYDVIGVCETGWHDSIEWDEGGWVGIGRGRKVGEKKGGGAGILMKEKAGRTIEEINPTRDIENQLGYNKGDIVTVKVREQKEVWWVTVVYMGVEGRGNQEDNRKLFEAMLEIKEKVGRDKWVIMGDMNGHIGLMEERVNRNGELLLDFSEKSGCRIKNWESENPTTWRDRNNESAIDYILVNESVNRQGCRIWKNEDVDISDHSMIGITCGKHREENNAKKVIWKEKWDVKNANWIEYCRGMENTMPGDTEGIGSTVSEWEQGIKNVIRQEAKKAIGTKQFKIGKTRLKGWWDKEVGQAIRDRKKENRKQKSVAKLARLQGGRYEEEWREAWDRYQEAKKRAQSLVWKKIGMWEEEQA
ncbi:hypothetical protein GWK47_011916 [Chionoecetes opilio]|uniref:Endonuclease/exonuclease/phosphatase domain-containing protein n=1 Tax=Chionoecetes opilio TaxID=41210 RepID=A0A8J4XVG8_CHIOP|nr:hypothetical protein GWK47_011916 [Chionoecetes opilio]